MLQAEEVRPEELYENNRSDIDTSRVYNILYNVTPLTTQYSCARKGCPLLECVSLSYCSKITNAGVFRLTQNCSGIQRLYLDYCSNVSAAMVCVLLLLLLIRLMTQGLYTLRAIVLS